MIPESIKQSLMKNWSEKAEAMDCFIEIKFTDEDQKWNYYIYALNPYDEDEAMMIVDTIYEVDKPFTITAHLSDLLLNDLEVDIDFRKMKASTLFKKLKGDN